MASKRSIFQSMSTPGIVSASRRSLIRQYARCRPPELQTSAIMEKIDRQKMSSGNLDSRAKTSSSSPGLILTRRASSDTGSDLRKTPLYDFHVAHGAKMVPFGGYLMPVQYEDQGIGESHRWTRQKASLFDVSHMVQHQLQGPGAAGLLSRITPSSISSLEQGRSTLSCLLHPGTGGIVDDTVITAMGPNRFYMVTNAACRDKDKAYLTKNTEEWRSNGKPDVEWEVLEEQGLLALQGPLAVEILESVLWDGSSQPDLKTLYFGQAAFVDLRTGEREASPVYVSRGGYTGEDGFELSTSPHDTVAIAEALVKAAGPNRLRLAGLGARDSLRLEAGMCLYGHDMDDSTTPVEAGLSWVVGKDRRAEKDVFHGSEVILDQLKPKKDGGTGVSRRRVGLVVEGAPAREGAEIVDEEGKTVGKITSGCPSPTLNKNIAMGYIKQGLHKAGTEVSVVVRGKKRKTTITKMPFVAAKYYREGTSAG